MTLTFSRILVFLPRLEIRSTLPLRFGIPSLFGIGIDLVAEPALYGRTSCRLCSSNHRSSPNNFSRCDALF